MSQRKNRQALVRTIGIEKDQTNLFLQTYKVKFDHGMGVGHFKEEGINRPQIHAFVTWASVPGLTIEMFENYRKSVLNAKNFDD